MVLKIAFQEIHRAVLSCPKDLRWGQYICNLFLTGTGFQNPESIGFRTERLFYCENKAFWTTAEEFFSLD